MFIFLSTYKFIEYLQEGIGDANEAERMSDIEEEKDKDEENKTDQDDNEDGM